MNSLPPDFDTCIIGKTVGPFAEQLVYSLSGLLRLCDGDREEVATMMKKAFTDHGAEAPVFVDDSLNDGGDEAVLVPPPDEPRIITEDSPKILTPFPGTPMN